MDIGTSGPYGQAWDAYRRAGWPGVLPLPPGRKGPPPSGFTGWAGVDPSRADIQTWLDEGRSAGNIGVHLPSGVYGLDVDNYGGKHGGEALTKLVEAVGPLPPTFVVSSRDDGVSGIRLYRATLTPGRVWVDEPGGHGVGIEAIHKGHRYAVVWPSVHPEGRVYTWRHESYPGETRVPRLDELPELPAEWVEALSREGEVRAGTQAGHDETVETVSSWREGGPCERVTRAAERAMGGLAAGAAGGAIHGPSETGTWELACLGHEGHAGVRKALAEHYAGHIEARVARDGEASRREADGEWWRLVRGAIGKLVGPRVEVCDCDLWSGEGVTLTADFFAGIPAERIAALTGVGEPDDSFWNARPGLKIIRQRAREMMVSPWATFGGVLAIVASQIAPHVVLPAIVGGVASLNIFVGLVGGSGSGKDAALAVAMNLVRRNASVPIHEIGTGQGIDSTYTSAGKTGPFQFCDSALFTLTEIDMLAAHATMTGSSVLATLRKVYTGGALGARYADAHKRRPVAAHHYRAALVAGIQPARSGVLLNDADGGTPQRWLWLPTNDPAGADWSPDEFVSVFEGWSAPSDMAAAGEIDDTSPPLHGRERVTMGVCDVAKSAIRAARKARLAAGLDDDSGREGHALLTRLKVAALLSLYDGRRGVTDNDWTLAECVMLQSERCRDLCAKALGEAVRRANTTRGHQEAERGDIAAERAIRRVAAHVDRTLTAAGDWMTQGALKKKVAARDRLMFDEALGRLVQAGSVEIKESDRATMIKKT